jgi:uncharacterized membrane protein
MSLLTYLSIHPDERHKRRKSFILDRKEILYILLLTFYFREVESATQATSALKTFVNETVINVTANSSFTTITIINNTTNLTGNGLTGEGLTQHNSLISAFTALYAVIIGFYFGSRAYEKIKELKDAEEVLKIQYITDEIGKDEFREKRGVLRGLKPNAQLVLLKPIISTEKKITIKHNGGDAIYLKDIEVVIKECGKKTPLDLAQYVSNEAYFKVTEVMVIDMKKGTIEVDNNNIIKEYLSSWDDLSKMNIKELKKILEEDPRIKLEINTLDDNKKPKVDKEGNRITFTLNEANNKNITFRLDEEKKEVTMEINGETYEYILKDVLGKRSIYKPNFYTAALTTTWKSGEEVEVNVVYKPTNEIISPMEKETITLK